MVEPVGRGGMGEVYKAVHSYFPEQVVALKVTLERFANQRQYRERFGEEIQIVKDLSPNSNIVELRDAGMLEDGRLWLATEFLEGVNVQDYMGRTRGPMAIPDALRICRDVCRGLEAAHQRGIVHRDLKPPNVFLTVAHESKILDFGTAKLTTREYRDRQVKSTAAGVIFGTVAYMSPDQLDSGVPVDFRTDLYSLGVMLYQLIAYRHPFAAPDGTLPDRMAIIGRILTHLPARLCELRPDVPEAVADLVAGLMEKKRHERPASAAAVAAIADAERARFLQAHALPADDAFLDPAGILKPSAAYSRAKRPRASGKPSVAQDAERDLSPPRPEAPRPAPAAAPVAPPALAPEVRGFTPRVDTELIATAPLPGAAQGAEQAQRAEAPAASPERAGPAPVRPPAPAEPKVIVRAAATGAGARSAAPHTPPDAERASTAGGASAHGRRGPMQVDRSLVRALRAVAAWAVRPQARLRRYRPLDLLVAGLLVVVAATAGALVVLRLLPRAPAAAETTEAPTAPVTNAAPATTTRALASPALGAAADPALDPGSAAPRAAETQLDAGAPRTGTSASGTGSAPSAARSAAPAPAASAPVATPGATVAPPPLQKPPPTAPTHPKPIYSLPF
ncbi:MAG: serine/threonine protein kinase [Myxococcales bacterium]|nr:serine/threonine protein kinase [Myxococcales bacterium]